MRARLDFDINLQLVVDFKDIQGKCGRMLSEFKLLLQKSGTYTTLSCPKAIYVFGYKVYWWLLVA